MDHDVLDLREAGFQTVVHGFRYAVRFFEGGFPVHGELQVDVDAPPEFPRAQEVDSQHLWERGDFRSDPVFQFFARRAKPRSCCRLSRRFTA